MIKFLKGVYVASLASLTVPERQAAQEAGAQALDEMTGPELKSLHNLVASNLGEPEVRRFSDNKAAVKRTQAILERYAAGDKADAGKPAAAPAPKPATPPAGKKERKKRGMRFVFPAEKEIKPVREGTARAKALAVLTQANGGTFEEVQKATGWNEKQAYEGIRLLHYYSGYGLKEKAAADGKVYITAHK